MSDDSNKGYNDDFSSLFGENSTNSSDDIPSNPTFSVDNTSTGVPTPPAVEYNSPQSVNQPPQQVPYQPQQPQQAPYQPQQAPYQPQGQPYQQPPYPQQNQNPYTNNFSSQIPAPYPMQNFRPKASGSGFLKASGIILIVIAAFVLLASLIFILGGSMMGDLLNEFDLPLGFPVTFSLTIIGVLILFIGALYLAEGIVFVKFSNRLDRANVCLVIAIIHMIFTVLSFFTSIENFSFASVLSFLIPVLALVGSLKNKKENEFQPPVPPMNNYNSF